MGRAPCCDKANVKKGPWSPEEDSKLKEYIEKCGTRGNWIALPQKFGMASFIYQYFIQKFNRLALYSIPFQFSNSRAQYS